MTVHPRVCGEHTLILLALDKKLGSSPRVRGTLLLAHRRPPGVRFIPACAGNIGWPAPAQPRPPVHPRVCGEHWR